MSRRPGRARALATHGRSLAEWLARFAPEANAPPAAETTAEDAQAPPPEPPSLRHADDASRRPARVVGPRATWRGDTALVVSVLALVQAFAIALFTASGVLARGGWGGAEPLFWLGILGIVLPAAWLLAPWGARRAARVAGVAMTGMALYALKVIHDPVAFSYNDEYVHQSNALDILEQHGMPSHSALLEVTNYYPGLAGVTAAMSQASGLSTFVCGLIVIGAARLVFTLSLFFLIELLTGSHRAAVIGSLVYAGAPNYLFWGAQFSYSSLAFPLVVFTLTLVVLRGRTDDRRRRAAYFAACSPLILAVVTTHHLSGYALMALLVLISAAPVVGWGRRRQSAWGLAVLAVVAAVAWLVEIAPATEGYLGIIFERAFEGITGTAGGGGQTRRLFSSTTGYVPPPWERIVALAAVAAIAVVLPWALRILWRRRRRAPLIVLLGLAGAGFIASMPLRFVPAAWETANRASDYLFLGVALAAGTWGIMVTRRRGRLARLRGVVVIAFTGLVVMGGVLSGWPPLARLATAREAEVGGRVIRPQGFALAAWARSLGPAHVWVADEANGRILADTGRQSPLSARDGLSRTFLDAERYDENLRELAAANGLTYISLDERLTARDGMLGNAFPSPGAPPWGVFPRAEAGDRPLLASPYTDRVFDSGYITTYRLR